MPATAFEPAHLSVDRRRPRTKVATLGVLALVGTLVLPATLSGAATAVGLGAAESFAVVGSGTVTNTGPSVLNGDLGVSPGEALVGFQRSDGGPGIVNGALHAGDATAAAAQSDAGIAYRALAEQACDKDLTGTDLGGLTLTPGVYCFSSSAQLTGPLTLNAVGDPDAAFVFQIGTTLTTASDSSVQWLGDFATCGVFWQVGTAAIIGTDTAFVGTVITGTEAITANTGATVEGRLLALNAAVTLDTNVITADPCTTADEPPVVEPPVVEPPVVEPPADEPPADEPPADEPPADEPPADEPPADEPVDDTPVDETPVDEPPADDVTDGGTPDAPESLTGGPAVPLRGGPAVPSVTGGPAVPEITGGPAVPQITGGPAVPRPPLPATGSNTMLAAYALLAIMVGTGLVSVTHTKRTTT